MANLSSETPTSYVEAQQSSEYTKWKEAMNEEMESLKDHDMWDVVDRPREKKVIKSRWVYQVKGVMDKRLINIKRAS